MPGVRKHTVGAEPVLQALDMQRRGMTPLEIASIMKTTERDVRNLLRRGKRLVSQSETEDLTAFMARFDPHRLNRVLASIERRLDELEARFDVLPPQYRRDMPPGLWEYMLSRIPRAEFRIRDGAEFIESWRRGETIPPPKAQKKIEQAFARVLAREHGGDDDAEEPSTGDET